MFSFIVWHGQSSDLANLELLNCYILPIVGSGWQGSAVSYFNTFTRTQFLPCRTSELTGEVPKHYGSVGVQQGEVVNDTEEIWS